MKLEDFGVCHKSIFSHKVDFFGGHESGRLLLRSGTGCSSPLQKTKTGVPCEDAGLVMISCSDRNVATPYSAATGCGFASASAAA